MANLVEEKKYVMSTVGSENHNKVWLYKLYDDGTWQSEWGRVGATLQTKTFTGGKYAAEKKAQEKLAKGYREVKIVGNVSSSTSSSDRVVNNSSLLDIAKKQIQHSCPVVGKLIEYLTKVNAHQIFSASGGHITYNDTTGLFQTPIGVVSKESIDEARRILVTIGDCVAQRDFKSSRITHSVEDYLMLIPQEVPRQLTCEAWVPDLTAVQKQNSLLDGLEASYASVISGANKKSDSGDTKVNEPPKIFDVKLELLQDTKEFDRIKRKIDSTRQGVHVCSHLRVDKIYSVDIKTMTDAFNMDGCKLSNIWELYHGSGTQNLLSLLKSGMKLPSQLGSAHTTGAMFGYPGLYFSDQSTKSLNYSYGYWSGGRNDRCFMFLADVGMGNYCVPSGPTSSKPGKGYDSYFAKAHHSGVMNNEMIVFRTSQAKLKYLVEFNR